MLYCSARVYYTGCSYSPHAVVDALVSIHFGTASYNLQHEKVNFRLLCCYLILSVRSFYEEIHLIDYTEILKYAELAKTKKLFAIKCGYYSLLTGYFIFRSVFDILLPISAKKKYTHAFGEDLWA